MKLQLKSGKLETEKNDLIALGLHEGEKQVPAHAKALDAALGGLIASVLASGDFPGKSGSTMLLPTGGKVPAKRLLLIGLGKAKDFTEDKLRLFWGKAATTTRDLGVRSFSGSLLSQGDLRVAAQAAAEGVILGLYAFNEYKTLDEDARTKAVDSFTLLVEKADEAAAKVGFAEGQAIAESVVFTRDLVTLPGGALTPSVFADKAKAMARQVGLTCQILDEKEIARLKMGGLLGVAQGSVKPPRFIVLEHKGKGAKGAPLVFVGKGITFDSGGISIKPGEGMEKMKYDMAGGAAVVGALRAIAALGLPLHVVGLVPTTENMPSGTAIHPGDVLTTMAGKTVEVINTDAEGRLILADALAYAAKYKPAGVVDLATLTGACVIALGTNAIGLMGNDEDLSAKVRAAGERTNERAWPLPMWDEYKEQIKSDIADIKNTGGRGAGTITAALFLAHFTESYPWVHLDIAGTAWDEKGKAYVPKGATGVGVRLLTQLARDWSGPSNGAGSRASTATPTARPSAAPAAKSAAVAKAAPAVRAAATPAKAAPAPARTTTVAKAAPAPARTTTVAKAAPAPARTTTAAKATPAPARPATATKAAPAARSTASTAAKAAAATSAKAPARPAATGTNGAKAPAARPTNGAKAPAAAKPAPAAAKPAAGRTPAPSRPTKK